ncbi:type II secretion system major pseudopilin GspG [Gynuella sunshinyii]|uniref:Type II secretion system core protein G n=1 Tax=Gynuella sunshinyii YC6258 TaxID=1445510 RepID=A0A0C5VZM0_9GAMM|nr:type II secretion system major pseudopilin GspG [Gynuella sunshinyii]AJQ95874.1 type II secretory pathway, pseudopilin PulG [Gynuella sunshinyii YC6258]
MMNNKQTGFSLLELMIAVLIMAAITGLVAPMYFGRQDEANQKLARTDLKTIETALDMYRLDNFVYPSTDQGLDALLNKPSGSPEAKNWRGPYIKTAPKDPWGNPYVYINNGSGSIEIVSYGKDGREGGEEADADISSIN